MTAASEFDYVIVGAGSSGCAAAWQLSARTEGTICVLEAGGSDDAAAIHDPASCYTLAAGEHDWSYRTIPQEHTGYRLHIWPSGRVVGGSSSINGMAYLRGCAEDYESWSYHGADQWDARQVFAAFAEIEAPPGATSRQPGGMLRLSMPEDLTEVAQAFLSASGSLGFARNDRLYLGELHGAGRPAWTIHDGQRQSAARAFLGPAVASGRVTVRCGSEAERITCEAGRAVGVECSDGTMVRATRQVIVSCGPVGSAALLLRSGIGPSRQLHDAGIPVVVDLPGVGCGLHDHVMASAVFEIDNSLDVPDQVLCQACLFAPSPEGGSAPEIQLSLVEGPIFANPQAVRAGHRYFTIIAGLSRPRSRGWVRVTSPSSTDRPVVNPAYLTELDDRRRLLRGLQLARSVGAAMRLGGSRAREVLPGPSVQDPAALNAYVSAAASTCFHPVGSCAMGTTAQSVVAPTLACHGLDGLSVIDSSVMPDIVSANTNAASIMIGWRGGAMAADLT